jgi:hypothetical protein
MGDDGFINAGNPKESSLHRGSFSYFHIDGRITSSKADNVRL